MNYKIGAMTRTTSWHALHSKVFSKNDQTHSLAHLRGTLWISSMFNKMGRTYLSVSWLETFWILNIVRIQKKYILCCYNIISLFIFITTLCGTDSIPQNILLILTKCGEYSLEYCESHVRKKIPTLTSKLILMANNKRQPYIYKTCFLPHGKFPRNSQRPRASYSSSTNTIIITSYFFILLPRGVTSKHFWATS